MVDRLSEMIIPTDEHSPGASGAQVSLFMDEGLADGKEEDQAAWTAGLIAVETEARSRFGAPFLDCSEGQQDEILAEMALNEKTPETDLQRFFGVLKAQTITGYYTSRVGLIEELEYKGIMPIAKFEACDHSDHKG